MTTPTHTIPETAFREDRQPAGAAEIEPAPVTDHLPIEHRVARIEAWMRDEIFARTAMDEPDPEPVTAGELEREALSQLGYFCGHVDHETWSDDGRAIIAKAIDLGLAVSPDDPRLQPLAVTDALCRVICDCLGWNPMHLERNTGAWELANHIIAHLNEGRGQS